MPARLDGSPIAAGEVLPQDGGPHLMSADLPRALLLVPGGAVIDSPETLRTHARTASSDTVDRALLGGVAAASAGWAFACGYEAALARLDPEATRGGTLCALCATEEGGGHPRAIRTSLVPRPAGGFVLAGRKSWVTLGADAQTLLVVATTGEDEQGRNRLRVARVPSSRGGVRVEPVVGGTPFASEIGHARAVFDEVAVDPAEVLPGDGYDTVLKPFRTIEDVHVMAAVLAWSIGVARASNWPAAWLEEALAGVMTWRAIGAAPPSDAATHIAVAGAIATTKRLLDAGSWSLAADAVRARWERDRPLLEVASKVRAARAEAAWRALAT